MLKIGYLTDVGRKRSSAVNQDAVAVVLPRKLINRSPMLIIADGMGGYQGGEVASRIAIEELKKTYRRSFLNHDPLSVLEDGIRKAHKKIINMAAKNPNLESMGSTVAAVIIENETIHLANVGDTQIYLINEKGIKRVSFDHSFVEEQVRQGLITDQEAHNHPKRNVLTMSLNAKRAEIEINTTSVHFGKDDVVLLCSDGLWALYLTN